MTRMGRAGCARTPRLGAAVTESVDASAMPGPAPGGSSFRHFRWNQAFANMLPAAMADMDHHIPGVSSDVCGIGVQRDALAVDPLAR